MRTSSKNTAWKILAYGLFTCSLAHANPSDPLVVSGSASFENLDANTLSITTSDQAVIEWREFSIAEHELAQFVQPCTCSVVINKVTSELSSVLMGSLKANGKVFLLNPNGVLFGENSSIDTNGFIASTLSAPIEDLLNGNKEVLFQGSSTAAIVNLGTITAWDGDIFLISYQINNEGSVNAQGGTAALGAGQEVLLRPQALEKIVIRPSLAKYENDLIGIDNSGVIAACKAELKSDGNAYAMAIRHTGDIDALGFAEYNGEVFLVTEGGNNGIYGPVRAKNSDGTGGGIQILGDHIALLGNAAIDVSGEMGGGTVLIGGDQSGSNPNILNAKTTYIEKTASINADAILEGNGGKVIAWADESTCFYGNISARGGQNAGDGGFVEVSGCLCLDFNGIADRLAPQGKAGTLLLDPTDITISVGGDTNHTGPFTFQPTGSPSNLNTGTLTGALAGGNVIVQSSGIGVGLTGAVTVNDAINYNTATNLTLNTQGIVGVTTGDITINAAIVNLGSGSISLLAVTDLIINPTSLSISSGGGSTITTSSGGNTVITGTIVTGDTIIATSGGAMTLNGAPGSRGSLEAGITATVTAVGNITLNGLHQEEGRIQSSGGPCSVTSFAGNISLNGSFKAGPFINAGTTCTVLAPAGSLTLIGGSQAIVSVSSGVGSSLTVNVKDQVILDATPGTIFSDEVFVNSGGPLLSFTAGSLIAKGGASVAVVGNPGPINVTLTGASPGGLTLIAGPGILGMPGTGNAEIFSTFSSVTITAPNSDMVMIGASSGIGIAQVNGATAPVSIAVNSLTMTGNATSSLIQTTTSSILDTLNIVANQAITLHPSSTIQIASGAPATPMLIIAGTDIIVDSGSVIDNLSGGAVTLVADNQFPLIGTFGNGKFVNNGSVAASSILPLRVYTSRRQLNTITGTLRGGPFIPGPLLVNTSTEDWFVWFPALAGTGFPYTILYKAADIFPPVLPSTALAVTLFNQAAYEFLQDLRDYDVFWYWQTRFTSDYDQADYERALPYFAKTSDVIGETTYKLLRKEYKENNGKLVNLLE